MRCRAPRPRRGASFRAPAPAGAPRGCFACSNVPLARPTVRGTRSGKRNTSFGPCSLPCANLFAFEWKLDRFERNTHVAERSCRELCFSPSRRDPGRRGVPKSGRRPGQASRLPALLQRAAPPLVTRTYSTSQIRREHKLPRRSLQDPGAGYYYFVDTGGLLLRPFHRRGRATNTYIFSICAGHLRFGLNHSSGPIMWRFYPLQFNPLCLANWIVKQPQLRNIDTPKAAFGSSVS
jgi:hypothetical protein